MTTFTSQELSLLIDALVLAAARRESQARWHQRLDRTAKVREFDETAAAMRRMLHKLMEMRQRARFQPAHAEIIPFPTKAD